MAFPTPTTMNDSMLVLADSDILSPLALTESVRIATPMTSIVNACVLDNTIQYGSIGDDSFGDSVKVPTRNMKPSCAAEGGCVLSAEQRPVQYESRQGSFVRPSLPDSSKELPLASSSSTAPFCGGGCGGASGGGSAYSSSSSNNPPIAPALPPPLPDHQRGHRRLAPPSHTGSIHRRGSTYSGQMRGTQRWEAPRGQHYGNQHHDQRGSYGWYNPQGPDHNLYTGMPLPPPLPGSGQPYVYASPVIPMAHNGVVPAYNAQFVPQLNTYPRVPLDTYRMPFDNFQRPPPPPPSPIRIRSPVDNGQLIVKRQIEYYFSVDNLCKDIFLRGNMDDQGWVPVSLIATFNMVKRVTTSTTEILNALRGSTVVEIQAEKIRRRGDWMRWLLPSTENSNGHDSVIHPMQTLGLEDSSSQTTIIRTQTEVLDSGSASRA